MQVGVLEIEMLANMARLRSDMEQAKGVVTSTMTHIDKTLDSTKKALGAFGVGLSINYFGSFVKGTVDAADNLNDLRKSTGLTVQELSGVKLLAGSSGSTLEGTAKIINKLSQEMGKNAAAARELGIRAQDPLEAVKQLSDVYLSFQNPQERAAALTKLLGKSWQEASPLLAEGSTRIQEIVDRGAALSGVTQKMADDADQMNDQVVEMTMAFEGLKNRAIGPLIPEMTKGIKVMTDFVASGDFEKWGGRGVTVVETLATLFAARLLPNVIRLNGAWPAGVAESIRYQKALADKAGASLRTATAIGALQGGVGALTTGVRGLTTLMGGPWATAAIAAGAGVQLLVQRQKELAEENWRVAQSFDEVLARLGSMTQSELAKNAVAVNNQVAETVAKIRELEATRDSMDLDPLSDKYKEFSQQINTLNVHLTAQRSNFETLMNQLRGLQGGTRGLSEEQKAAAAYVRAMETGLESLNDTTLTAARYIEMMNIKTDEQRKREKELNDQRQANLRQDQQHIATLAQEAAQLSMTSRERAIYAAQSRLSADATAEMRAQATAFAIQQWEHAEAQRNQIELERLASEAVEEHMQKQAEAAKEAKRRSDELAENALRVQSDLWSRIDDVALDAFTSIEDGGRGVMERLEDALKSGLLALLYEMTLKTWIINIAANVSGESVAKQAFGSAAGSALGSFAGGGGILAAGSQFLGGLTNGAIGTNSMMATGASSLGAGINSAIGAIPGWGWAAMAAAVAAKLLVTKETPSMNAGMFLKPLPGISGQFATDRFASGLEVVGYSRRASQADAEESIDVFRKLDATLTELRKKAGLETSLSASNFTGLDERGLGTGVFLGVAGEDGIPGKGLREQADQFVIDWLTAVKDSMDEADFQKVISAGGADHMIEAYGKVLEKAADDLEKTNKRTEEIAAERVRLQDRLDNATMDNTQLLEKQRGALNESNRALFDQVQAAEQAQRASEEAKRRQEQVVNERSSIERRLLQLTENTNAMRWLEIAALDASSRALQMRVFAIEDAQSVFDKSMTGVSSAMSTLQKAVQAERERVTKTFSDSTKVINDSLTRVNNLSSSLKSTLSSLGIGPTPTQARAQLSSALAIARAGVGLPTAEALEPALRVLGKPSEDLYATFVDYQRDFYRTANDIAELESLAQKESQAKSAELKMMELAHENEMARLDGILMQAQKELDALNGINTSVLSVAAALASYQAAILAATAAKAALGAAKADAIPGVKTGGYENYSASEIRAYVSDRGLKTTADLYAHALMKNADPIAVGAALGYTDAETRLKLRDAGIPGYARGGAHPGGWAIVGEEGPELRLMGPSRVASNNDSRSLLAAANDEAVREFRAMRLELVGAREELSDLRRHQKQMLDIIDQWDGDGMPVEREEA